LGCPVLQNLCAVGVGTIGIIDFDTIELHNLHRQILYSTADLGKSKASIAAEKLKANNPNISFLVFNEMLNEQNAEKIISPFDIVVDGSDNFITRYLVNDSCVKLNKPIVYGSILNLEGQFTVFNYKGSKNLRDLFPEPPDAEDVPSCDENGVPGTLPPVIASLMAHETLKMIVGMEIKINRLILIDTKSWNFTSLNY
jgi:adenylyltransferase/sulfurtransferase